MLAASIAVGLLSFGGCSASLAGRWEIADDVYRVQLTGSGVTHMDDYQKRWEAEAATIMADRSYAGYRLLSAVSNRDGAGYCYRAAFFDSAQTVPGLMALVDIATLKFANDRTVVGDFSQAMKAAVSLSKSDSDVIEELVPVLSYPHNGNAAAFAAMALGLMKTRATAAIPALIEAFPVVAIYRVEYEWDHVSRANQIALTAFFGNQFCSSLDVPTDEGLSLLFEAETGGESVTKVYGMKVNAGAAALAMITGERFGREMLNKSYWEQRYP
jgi:hypothetical protein